MIYNQFLWVMFPQWEWSGNEQATLYWARLSLCPIGHLLLVSKQKEFMEGLFQVYEMRVSSKIFSGNTREVCTLSKAGFLCWHLTWQLVALWLSFFFLRHFFLLGWSVQIVLKVNTEMSKSDFYLSHNRDNSCWTLGWVPDLSRCYGVRLKNDS